MSHDNSPPSLPKVVIDEAGDTPNWVPALGAGLLALFAILIAVRYAQQPLPTEANAKPAVAAELPTK